MKLLHLRNANRVAFAASVLAFLLLCVCVVYWATLLLAPRSPIAPVEVVADPRASGDARGAASLFGVGGVQGEPVATVSDIQVIGLAASRTRATAILAFDGKPARAYGEGEMLSRGIKLVQVSDDAIIIERNGSRQKLEVPARASLAVLNSAGASRPRSELIVPVTVTRGAPDSAPAENASPTAPSSPSSGGRSPTAPAMMAPPPGTAAPSLPAPGAPGYDAPPPPPAQASMPPGVAMPPAVNPLNRQMPESDAPAQ